MGRFNVDKLKVNLKLAINRLKLLQSKKAGLNAQQRREIATLLEKGKDESARIKVEHIIREDLLSEALEILELYCELLLARIGVLEQMQECDSSIAEAVNTVIYAAPRSGIKELSTIRDILVMKYGAEFAQNAMENKNEVVNARIVQKLKGNTPDPFLVTQYLKEIAAAYNVAWDANTSVATMESALNGTGKMGISATTLGMGSESGQSQLVYPVNYNTGVPPQEEQKPPSNSSETSHKPGSGSSSVKSQSQQNDLKQEDNLQDFDELSRRFEALKKR